ncbi:dipeptide transport ATP-binding protein DppD [Pullulanibacillus camelliae]|uniref:Dipeptide transport ATP-binding protein DppD n=1 Tax=Pullulanibacillus camelliae TaxID=1707096 RepID=A0A8J2VM59_9BACL|nr:ABC transporter ATP-binding protein [Pullulanibacillus camelliae]GGE32054.1 dipeptide transport ATP-binding protein DppD [Pullulanibacillus camelliae]
MSETILEIKDLHVSFTTYGGEVQAVRGVNVTLNRGETLAIVGESGCGKTVTSQSIMRLTAGNITKGSIRFKGKDLTRLTEKQMRDIRGSDISMIFQDPMTSLNPTLTVGKQIIEGVERHQNISRHDAERLALEIFDWVGIANGKERLKQYPHQFSGGMRQRIMIAMALVCKPSILIADEPTTALDVTIQAQILELFKEIQRETGVSIILITHDMGVVAQVSDRIAIMYAGKVVEIGRRKDIFYRPQHPYTKGLLHSIPRMDSEEDELIPIPGTPPDLFSPPKGCPFVARCPFAMEVCEQYQPITTAISSDHAVDCWLQDERAKQVTFTGEV